MFRDLNAVKGDFTAAPPIAFVNLFFSFFFFTASYDALEDKMMGQGQHKSNIFKHR